MTKRGKVSGAENCLLWRPFVSKDSGFYFKDASILSHLQTVKVASAQNDILQENKTYLKTCTSPSSFSCNGVEYSAFPTCVAFCIWCIETVEDSPTHPQVKSSWCVGALPPMPSCMYFASVQVVRYPQNAVPLLEKIFLQGLAAVVGVPTLSACFWVWCAIISNRSCHAWKVSHWFVQRNNQMVWRFVVTNPSYIVSVGSDVEAKKNEWSWPHLLLSSLSLLFKDR